MEDVSLIVDLVTALGVAFLGGFVAQKIGLPVLIGYIAAGVLIGPNTPGLVADTHDVEVLANIGVAFLMFAIGVELSLDELNRVRRVALGTAAIQIPLTVLLGFGGGQLIGWSWQASVLLGCGFAISSTIVAIKLSAARGELTSASTHTALGIGVVQDLSLVLMMAILPVLTGDSDSLLPTLGRSLGIAAIVLVAVIVLGTTIAPRLLFVVARIESRELFLLTIVLIALGTAIVAEKTGLSLALGAFLAGIIVSESEFNSQVLSEIIPLRDLFATLFFVSVGMLLEPAFVRDNAGDVVLLLALLVIGKIVIMGGALLAMGANYQVATRASTLLAQMGEFSFVLAGVALADGIIGSNQYGLILAVALASIVITPALRSLDPVLVHIAHHLPGVGRREVSITGEEMGHDEVEIGVVICGYGRVGRVLGEVLARHRIPFSVIELNPVIVREIRDSGVPAYYGDAGSAELLRLAGINEARVFVVALPDAVSARAAVRQARRLHPELHIVARSSSRQQVPVLQQAGANSVIQPEIEAGLHCVLAMLQALGMPDPDIDLLVAARRQALYRDTA